MSTIRKSLLQLMFSGSCMRRWNDKLRPVELYEVDKQAHKMIVAWMLTRINSRQLDDRASLDLHQKVVERGLFDYLYRLITTDIKPPVFYKILENPQDRQELTRWVLGQLQPVVQPLDAGFWERLVDYHRSADGSASSAGSAGSGGSASSGDSALADRILRAAHLYASGWEFNVIRPFNSFDEEADYIASYFLNGLREMEDVIGVADLIAGDDMFSENSTALGRFARRCGQLRFQIRWAETSRLPETSVLGHMFLVGGYAYFCSLVVGACQARSVNNFFSGLFHDLPELLTRDIITPVKRSVDQLPRLIRDYELQELQSRIFTPLTEAGHEDLVLRLRYYLGLLGEGVDSEFNETTRDASGVVRRMKDFDDLQTNGNANNLDPKDGELLKACDNLAAFMEAHTAIRHGVSSPGLYEASTRIRSRFRDRSLGPISLATLLADFD